MKQEFYGQTFAVTLLNGKSKAARGTVWGAYNAISGYFGHIADYKSETQRMNTIMFGRGADKVQKAFELATALI